MSAFALALIVLAVYQPVLHYGFIVFDDTLTVTGNTHLQGGFTWEGCRWAFTTTHTGNWHPLTWLSHMLDVQVFGSAPGGHHLTNVLFHAANTILLFLVLRALTGAVGRSVFAAALFAVHPLHVESVAWVSERKDVLSTFFWLTSMAAYVRYVRKPTAGGLAAALAAFACGLMSKPMVVTLPFVLLLLDFWPLGRFGLARSRILLEKAPFVVLAALSGIVTYLAQGQAGAVNLTMQAQPWIRSANALTAYAKYIGKMFWPGDLAVYYPLSGQPPPWWQVAAAGLLMAGLSVAALRTARRLGYLATGWFWYVGTLVPVIGLVQVGGQSMADRYTYIPLVGLFVVISWGGFDLAAGRRRRRALLGTAAAVATLALAAGARVQVGYWRDSTTLLSHAARITTDNWLIHGFLGDEMMGQGRPREAADHYRENVRISPGSSSYRYKLGVALTGAGQGSEATAQYREALRLDPGHVGAHNNLGLVLFETGRVDEALGHFGAAARLDPKSDLARHNIAEILRRRGQYLSAIEYYREALRLNPGLREAAVGLEAARRAAAARPAYR